MKHLNQIRGQRLQFWLTRVKTKLLRGRGKGQKETERLILVGKREGLEPKEIIRCREVRLRKILRNFKYC